MVQRTSNPKARAARAAGPAGNAARAGAASAGAAKAGAAKAKPTDPALRAMCDLQLPDLVARPGAVLETLRAVLDPNVPGRPGVRRNEAHLTNAERAAFIAAIEVLRNTAGGDGVDVYSKLVQIHANMDYNMHGSMGPAGRDRFLPWHRVYLRVFERLLQAADPAVTVPYWEWSRHRTVPPWLLTYLPLVQVTLFGFGAPHQVVRGPGVVPTPSREEVWRTVHEPAAYVPFTTQLEGHHNQVHVWVGGSMALAPTAPADPVFWLHHAEVDRLWHLWQTRHPGQRPTFTGQHHVMTPWPETYDEVHDIGKLGYAYAETTFERGEGWPGGQQLPTPAHLLSAALVRAPRG